MSIKAVHVGIGDMIDHIPATDISAGSFVRKAGLAMVALTNLEAGRLGSVASRGLFRIKKSTNVTILDGGRVFWDASAAEATFRKVEDSDFYLGRAVGDAAAADDTVLVDLNSDPKADVDAMRDGYISVATGTAAAGGFGLPVMQGGSARLTLTATNEAQTVDMLSTDRHNPTSGIIAEFAFRIQANGSTTAVNFNIGLANATSTSNADSITERAFFHINGGSAAINAKSDDGTTQVSSTDTTKVFNAGTAAADRVECWIDARNTADVKYYINGERVLEATTFKLDAATGPLALLAHLSKTASTATAGPIFVDRAEMRLTA